MKWKQTQTTIFQCFREAALEATATAADDTKQVTENKPNDAHVVPRDTEPDDDRNFAR